MRVAIISDIHSNYQGLQSVLEELEGRDVDEIWSTGDFVNYGADPGLVMDWAMDAVSAAVLGNHDAVVVGRESPTYFNRYARQTIPYTRDMLSAEQYRWLENLGYVWKKDGIRLVHASPDNPEEWTYVMSRAQAMSLFGAFDEQLCFIGHTHVQGAFDSEGNQYREEVIALEEGKQYLVNSGSAGQPRDGDPRCGFSIYDSDEMTVELLRGEYEVGRASQRIVEEGLPEFLGSRLHQGR